MEQCWEHRGKLPQGGNHKTCAVLPVVAFHAGALGAWQEKPWGCGGWGGGLADASRHGSLQANFVGRIKGAKCPFDLQFLTWDFS